jgi:hypothetical protein
MQVSKEKAVIWRSSKVETEKSTSELHMPTIHTHAPTILTTTFTLDTIPFKSNLSKKESNSIGIKGFLFQVNAVIKRRNVNGNWLALTSAKSWSASHSNGKPYSVPSFNSNIQIHSSWSIRIHSLPAWLTTHSQEVVYRTSPTSLHHLMMHSTHSHLPKAPENQWQRQTNLGSTIIWDITSCSPLKCQLTFQSKLHSSFLLGLFFDLEDGRDKSLQNVSWLSTNYTVLHPRWRNSS